MRKPIKRGEDYWSAVLKATDIPVIRQRVSEGEPLSSVARSYDVDKKTVWNAARGFSWKHVK